MENETLALARAVISRLTGAPVPLSETCQALLARYPVTFYTYQGGQIIVQPPVPEEESAAYEACLALRYGSLIPLAVTKMDLDEL